MKIASFKAGQTATYGLVTNAGVIDAGKRLKAFPTLKALLADGSLDALKALQRERPDYALAEIDCCRPCPIRTRFSASASTMPRISPKAVIPLRLTR